MHTMKYCLAVTKNELIIHNDLDEYSGSDTE